MEFTIKIDSSDDAMMSNPDGELSKLLQQVQDMMFACENTGWKTLRDSNGNRVGNVEWIFPND